MLTVSGRANEKDCYEYEGKVMDKWRNKSWQENVVMTQERHFLRLFLVMLLSTELRSNEVYILGKQEGASVARDFLLLI